MLMAVNEPYALMVQPDDILISPREVDEHFGTMVCFHPRYALGDHHNHMDKDDFLREMYLDTVAGFMAWAFEPAQTRRSACWQPEAVRNASVRESISL